MSREEDKAETWRIISEPQERPAITILKQRVSAKTRALSAMWSVEVDQELEHDYGVDVEKELQKKFAKEIANNIDLEMLKSLKGRPK